VERVVSWLRERLPGVDAEPVAVETCLYTTTPDERFILERRGRVVIGSPCSGHGFKFAPAVGRKLAELALEEENRGA
jgi:sarcosine oxidase